VNDQVGFLEDLLAQAVPGEKVRCTKCSLWETSLVKCAEDGGEPKVVRRTLVGNRGDPRNPIMLVGEAPGDYEVALDTPFVGPAGQFLNQHLDQLGLAKQVWVANTIRCKLPLNRVPNRAIYEPCLDYLWKDIARYRPRVIGLLGGTATREVLRMFGFKKQVVMQDVVGDVFLSDRKRQWQGGGPYLIPAYHPAAYLRREKQDPLEWLDPISFTNAIRMMASYAGIEVPSALPDYRIADTFKAAKNLLELLEGCDTISFDLETSPPDTALRRGYPVAREDKILCISFCWAKGKAATIPWRHQVATPGQALQPFWTPAQEAVLHGTLKRLLEDPTIKKIGHNARLFDCRILRHDLGIRVKGFHIDGMVLSHLIDQEGGHGLKELSFHWTELGNYEEPLDRAKSKLIRGSSYALLPEETLYRYAAADADAEWRVVDSLLGRIRNFDIRVPSPVGLGLEEFYFQIMAPVLQLADHMMEGGVYIDKDRVLDLIDQYQKEVTQVNSKLFELEEIRRVGTIETERRDAKTEAQREAQGKKPFQPRKPLRPVTFNCRSTKHMHTLLFDILELPVLHMTKKGSRATGKKVLEKYDHPVVNELSRTRQLLSYISYLKNSVLKNIGKDGMLRAEYFVIGTETGRWSSKRPINLQNIPNRGPRAKEIKSIFRARPGYAFIKEDYAQAEFRLLAIYANDEIMKEDIRTGFDVHRYVASVAFEKTEEEIQKDKETGGDLREKAKTGVFETIYGGGPETLAMQVGIPLEVAKKIQEAFWGRYRQAHQFVANVRAFARTTGFVRSLHGRIRVIRGIRGRKVDWVTKQDREASNSPIQGACHDENTTRAVNLLRAYKKTKLDARICLHIHDAILSEVAVQDLPKAMKVCSKVRGMLHPTFDISMPVEMEVGFSLSEMMKPEKFFEAHADLFPKLVEAA